MLWLHDAPVISHVLNTCKLVDQIDKIVLATTKEVADDFTYFDVEGDELQAELESWFKYGHGVGDEQDESINEAKCGCCGNDPCDCPKDCKGCMEESVDLEELKKLAGI